MIILSSILLLTDKIQVYNDYYESAAKIKIKKCYKDK